MTADVLAALQRITNTLQRFQHSGFELSLTQRDQRLLTYTNMQTLFNVRFASELDKALYETIMMHAITAERLGPGGFKRFLAILIDLIIQGKFEPHGHFRRAHDLPKEVINPDSESPSPCHSSPGNTVSHELPQSARHPLFSDIEKIVNEYAGFGDKRVRSMVQEALRLAGFAGRIVVEKTASSTASVELICGYTFELAQMLDVDVSFVSPRVVCIDGYVQEVSEVHRLLDEAAGAKEPLIMFLRGASDEVKHTLKVNYDRGSLRVIPVGVPFDLEGMNTLVDLSVIAGCDLISSLKGELISGVSFNDLKHVDQVTMFKGHTVITNRSTHAGARGHVSNLRKRRLEQPEEELAKFLDKRIRSLSPNHVVMRLPNDKDYVVNSQVVDCALRAVRSLIEHGVTSEGRLAVTEHVARVHAERCYRTLDDIGAFVGD